MSKGPVIAFVGVLAAGITSGVYFFGSNLEVEVIEPEDPALTEPAYPAEAESTTEETDAPAKPEGEPQAMNPSALGATTMEVTEAPVTPSPPVPSPHMTDTALVTDLADHLQEGNISGFLDLAGKETVSQEMKDKLRHLIVDSGYRMLPDQSAMEAPEGATGVKRWSLELSPPDDLKPLGKQSLDMELTQDDVSGWKIVAMRVPDLREVTARFEAGMPDGMGEPFDEDEPTDAISVAQNFVGSVVRRDFKRARRYIDSASVSDEKLAALFIVVEEGKFRMPDTSPLVATVDQGPRAWIIARLIAPDTNSEFGLEMSRVEDESWRVTGLHMSQLLQARAMEAGAGDVAYAPLKTDLSGGDSLVLYFEYDADQVNTRAQKQLQIIADILDEDPERKLHINGHADAMGDEIYNEQLSDQRATNVREQLLAFGIPAQQIVTRAFGESAPKAPNLNPDGTDNPNGRALNRRAEVLLQF